MTMTPSKLATVKRKLWLAQICIAIDLKLLALAAIFRSYAKIKLAEIDLIR